MATLPPPPDGGIASREIPIETDGSSPASDGGMSAEHRRIHSTMPGRSASGACAPHTTPTRIDPRLYQIAVLTGLLAYGLLRLRFEVRWPHVVITLAAALLTQAWCSRRAALPFDPRSALISGLSLCLLLRTGSPLVSTAAAVIAIASKFALRWRGKHVWNPTNLAVVVM